MAGGELHGGKMEWGEIYLSSRIPRSPSINVSYHILDVFSLLKHLGKRTTNRWQWWVFTSEKGIYNDNLKSVSHTENKLSDEQLKLVSYPTIMNPLYFLQIPVGWHHTRRLVVL